MDQNYPKSIHGDLLNAANAESTASPRSQFSGMFKNIMGLHSRTWREAPMNSTRSVGIRSAGIQVSLKAIAIYGLDPIDAC